MAVDERQEAEPQYVTTVGHGNEAFEERLNRFDTDGRFTPAHVPNPTPPGSDYFLLSTVAIPRGELGFTLIWTWERKYKRPPPASLPDTPPPKT